MDKSSDRSKLVQRQGPPEKWPGGKGGRTTIFILAKSKMKVNEFRYYRLLTRVFPLIGPI